MGAAYYINQLKTKVKKNIDRIRLIVGDFNTPLTAMDTSPRQKINKTSRALNDPLGPMDSEGIYRAVHPNTTEYSFFPGAHGTFSRIDQILSHKSGLN